jgi:pimeloyl-ACP methyl ester carboxylesterase
MTACLLCCLPLILELVLRSYELLLVGHSRGGGIAALVALLLSCDSELQQQLGGARVHAVTYATPPVVTRDLAEQSVGIVECCINRDDMVSQ